MPGIGDTEATNVGRRELNFIGEAFAETLLSADREHGHGELALGQERLIVDAVLAEGRKLGKGVVDGLRARIQPGVPGARRLIDMLRVRRQLVIKTVEIE